MRIPTSQQRRRGTPRYGRVCLRCPPQKDKLKISEVMETPTGVEQTIVWADAGKMRTEIFAAFHREQLSRVVTERVIEIEHGG